MNLADVFTVVLVVLGVLSVFIAVWLATAGLFPALASRCAERLGDSPFGCAAAGLGAAIPLLTAGVMLGRASTNPLGKLGSAVVLILTLIAMLAGTTGLALRIGRGLASARDGAEPWRRVLRGGVVLALTFLSLVMIPLTLVPGLGALLLAGRRKPGTDPTNAAG
ncbi:MAG: hypothetical protein LW690_10215 [Opitutaceae bacterium]|jgi:hypothetical protein|nr:hypothetical protein [Opitutaceae bacterium]